VVKKAKDRKTGRLVALKVMNKNERSVCRCRKEAEMQALCHAHPSIASVENFVETPEAFVIVQEYADRGDCASAFVSGKLSQPLSVFARVVDSVAYMHARNIAHLDIKVCFSSVPFYRK
jgi:serine/threonine protein kinase